MWRCLAIASVLTWLAAITEVGARSQLTGLTTPRRALALWVLALVALGLGAPSAVALLKQGASGRVRQAIAVGFICFDVLAGLVVWRWSAGGKEFGGRWVAVLASVVAVALLVVTLRGARDRTFGAFATGEGR
jgi:hypothetical protein